MKRNRWELVWHSYHSRGDSCNNNVQHGKSVSFWLLAVINIKLNYKELKLS